MPRFTEPPAWLDPQGCRGGRNFYPHTHSHGDPNTHGRPVDPAIADSNDAAVVLAYLEPREAMTRRSAIAEKAPNSDPDSGRDLDPTLTRTRSPGSGL